MNYHLAILKKQYINAILAGKKTVESRFTKTRRPPLGQITLGDKIFFKAISGPVLASACVQDVITYDNLCRYQIAGIKKQFNQHICAPDQFWTSINQCRYGVLIWLKGVKPIEPVTINKKDLRAWVVLTRDNNYDLLE